jgi:hypothetical protein
MYMTTSFNNIKEMIKSDAEYAWGWHCNIAMTAQDEGVSHEISNKAAARIMQNIFGVDTSQSEFYKNLKSPQDVGQYNESDGHKLIGNAYPQLHDDGCQ